MRSLYCSLVPNIPSGYCNVLIPATAGFLQNGAAVTFGVENNTIFTVPEPIAELVWDAFDSSVRPFLDSSVTWGPVHVQVGLPGGISSGDGTSSDIGGATIESVPSNTAVLVRKHSAQPGRGGRGRYFWPCAANEADVSEGGLWNQASVDNFQDGQDDFLIALNAADLPMVILHAGAGTPATVTTLNTQQLLATQRRRMRR